VPRLGRHRPVRRRRLGRHRSASHLGQRRPEGSHPLRSHLCGRPEFPNRRQPGRGRPGWLGAGRSGSRRLGLVLWSWCGLSVRVTNGSSYLNCCRDSGMAQDRASGHWSVAVRDGSASQASKEKMIRSRPRADVRVGACGSCDSVICGKTTSEGSLNFGISWAKERFETH